MNNKGTDWWKDAVVYQIYPRSFADANGDGIGDLPGIVSRLDYLSSLGIDAVWLSPVYRSPQFDNGYDISDYRDIDPIFGSMEDMRTLIREAGARGIRILMDLVLNHSSDEHAWFQAAKRDPHSPYHEYYIWRDGKPGTPPNEMRAGYRSAWEWVPEAGQYYFHQFSVKQPDLNWENPALRAELYDMIRFWIDEGVGGFRLDVVDQLGKDPDHGITFNGPRLHEFLREMRREAFVKPDLLTVGEAWSADIDSAKLYSDPKGSELSMVFQFEPFLLDQTGREKWDLAPLPFLQFKEVVNRWQTGLSGCGWNSLFWENHDLPRIVSRFGDDGTYRTQSARMLAILLFGLQGTPYIYQGQELGMTNVRFPLEAYQDIETLEFSRERLARGMKPEDILPSIHAKSRDNARTPMQWTDGENAGFTTGTPWLPVNPNHKEINVELEERDPESVLHCYRKLIRLRREYPVFRNGHFRLLLPEDESIFAYTREDGASALFVLCNFYGREIADPLADKERGTLLIANYPDEKPGHLRPYEARMYLLQ